MATGYFTIPEIITMLDVLANTGNFPDYSSGGSFTSTYVDELTPHSFVFLIRNNWIENWPDELTTNLEQDDFRVTAKGISLLDDYYAVCYKHFRNKD